MDIRNYKEQDLHEIEKLIADIYIKDKSLKDYYMINFVRNKVNAVVAVEDKKVIGFGNTWNNKFHNNADYIGINVLEGFRGRGAGNKIFNALESNCHKDKLQCALKSDNKEGGCFVKELGFELLRRTFEPVYDLSEDMNFDNKIAVPDDFIIKHISEIDNPEDKCRLISLYKKTYTGNHTFNKVSSLSDDQWENIIYRDLCPEGSFIILHNSEITAFSFIYYGEDNDTLELGMRGVKPEYKYLEKDLIMAIINRQIGYAKENKFSFIKDEIDDCDSGAMVMAEFLDLEKLVSWNTFLKYRKN